MELKVSYDMLLPYSVKKNFQEDSMAKKETIDDEAKTK